LGESSALDTTLEFDSQGVYLSIVIALIRRMSKDELPMFLTHEHFLVREEAKDRLIELEGWESP